MRFITEFEREVISIPDAEFVSNFPHVRKMHSEVELGQMISNIFGWKENTVKMFGEKEMNRWSLEIEAFPMDKWMRFKTKLFNMLLQENVPTKYFDKIIEELESFGKPSGDTQYFLDTKENKLYRDNGDGKIEDITNPK